MIQIVNEVKIRNRTLKRTVRLRTITDISIYSDIDILTDTAIVNIPSKNTYLLTNESLKMTAKDNTISEISVGDEITIVVNFDNFKTKIAFGGYISRFVYNDDKISIECEDKMYFFKNEKFKFSIDKKTKRKYKRYAKRISGGIIGGPFQAFPIPEEALRSRTIGPVIVDGPERISKLQDIVDIIFDNMFDSVLNTNFESKYLGMIANTYVTDINSGRYNTKTHMTGAQILQEMKDYYGIFVYFRFNYYKKGDIYTKYIISPDGSKKVKQLSKASSNLSIPVLHVGLKYLIDERADEDGYRNIYKFGFPASIASINNTNNIIDVSGLEYNTINKEIQLIVIYNSKQDDNKVKQSATADGKIVKITKEEIDLLQKNKNVVVTKNIPNLDQKSLDKYVLDNWNNYPSNHLVGTFKTFGEPLVRIGDVVNIIMIQSFNGLGQEINENYFVDKVNTMLNESEGFVQNITLGAKIE